MSSGRKGRVGNPMRLRSSLYDPNGKSGGAGENPVGFPGLGGSEIEGNTRSGVAGRLCLKFGGGLGEWGRGDLRAKRGRREGHPCSGGFGLVRSWAGADLLRW
jgi:hypothetical protein